jgi:uncharacterized protein (TIGR01777 family)
MAESLQGQTVVVTGPTGLVGTPLVASLEAAGAKVIRGTRRPTSAAGEMYWNGDKGEIDAAKLEGVDAVVHLAGENIAGRRWSESFKREIRDSRVKGTRLIAEAIARATNKPKALICASAIGYYGNRGDELLNENSPPGDDFLADVCREWEVSCQPARDAGVRVINTRIGVILSPKGGALHKMLTPFKLGLGGKISNGQQYMSWIALDDVVGALHFLVAHQTASGPVNLTAPNPVTNADFTNTLGHVLRRPTVFPFPAFAARLRFGEMADALLLSSTRVAPQALEAAGYAFQLPQLEPALRHLLA